MMMEMGYVVLQISAAAIIAIQLLLVILQAVNQIVITQRAKSTPFKRAAPVGLIQRQLLVVSAATTILGTIVLIDPFSFDGTLSFATVQLLMSNTTALHCLGGVFLCQSAFRICYSRENLHHQMPSWIRISLGSVVAAYAVAINVLCALLFDSPRDSTIISAMYFATSIEFFLLFLVGNTAAIMFFRDDSKSVSISLPSQNSTSVAPSRIVLFAHHIADQSLMFFCCLAELPRVHLRRLWTTSLLISPLVLALVGVDVYHGVTGDISPVFDAEHFNWRQHIPMIAQLLVNGLYMWQGWLPLWFLIDWFVQTISLRNMFQCYRTNCVKIENTFAQFYKYIYCTFTWDFKLRQRCAQRALSS